MCIVNILDCTMEIEYFIYRTSRELETGYKYLVVYMSYRIIFGYLSSVGLIYYLIIISTVVCRMASSVEYQTIFSQSNRFHIR